MARNESIYIIIKYEMVTRTFLSKSNTIVNGSRDNFGLNPICTLCYGSIHSRGLVWFDVNNIKKRIDDGTYIKEHLTHRLKMYNCGSWDPDKYMEKKEIGKHLSDEERRAASYDIILFKLPADFDAGVGFDNSLDIWFVGYNSASQDGSTWYKSANGLNWDVPGIYTPEFLWKEYEKWGKGEKSIVVGRQHFDYGNENLDIDITGYVNEVLEGGKNYGLGIAFSPRLELSDEKHVSYVGFFTNNTNTFFEPFVETRTSDVINDDRYKFYAGKTNRLYFYAVFGGVFTDLDELPTCEVEGVKYPVKKQSTGVYYAEVKLPRKKVIGYDDCDNPIESYAPRAAAVMYDTWGNLKYNGEELDDVELEFTMIPATQYFNFGDEITTGKDLVPTISGINDDEKLYQGDIRDIDVVFRLQYSSSEYELADNAYYRIYVKDGQREVDVIDWDAISSLGRKNTFTINTRELVPYDYYVDIKVELGREVRIYKNKLHFKVIDNVTEISRG